MIMDKLNAMEQQEPVGRSLDTSLSRSREPQSDL
jgi:hypothetical protein